MAIGLAQISDDVSDLCDPAAESPARGDERGLSVVCAEGGRRTALLH
jgi:hypothetical protein